MASKPLFYEGMTVTARLRALFWVILIPLLFLAILVGGYLVPRSSSSDRHQRGGESDYDYNQRIKAEDAEQYKDCGFKPTC